MLMRVSLLCLVGCFALSVAAPQARADKKPMKILQMWKGSVDDEKLQKDAPSVITNAKDLQKLWTAWKIKEPMPKVDFKKELVVITTGAGSKLNLNVNIDDTGNVEVLGFGTLDLVPGFRYVIAVINREGVRAVNNKELPKN